MPCNLSRATMKTTMRSRILLSLLAIFLAAPTAALAEMSSPNFVFDDVNFGSSTVITSSKDGIPPAITSLGPVITALSPTSVTITWETDKKSSSQVRYGTSASYGFTAGTTDRVTEHSVTLSGLTEQTTYHFRVESEDAYKGIGASPDYTFSTPARAQFREVMVAKVGYTDALITVKTAGLVTLRLKYGIAPKQDGLETAPISSGNAEHTFNLTKLQSGSKYAMTVEGDDNKGNEYKVEGITFLTTPEPKIESLSAEPISPNEISVNVITNTKTALNLSYRSKEDKQKQTAGDAALSTQHELRLAKLFGATDYTLELTLTDEGGKRVTKDGLIVRTLDDTKVPDASDPNIQLVKIGNRIAATTRWETDEPVKSRVTVVSKTNAKDRVEIPASSRYATEQIITVSGLTPKTPYELVAVSTDISGNETTRSISFVTPTVRRSILELISDNLSKVVDPIARFLGSK